MHLSIGKASTILGVSISNLRRWEIEGYLLPAFRTAGGHSRYEMKELEARFSVPQSSCFPVHALAYARFSSHDQKKDLETQLFKLKSYYDIQFPSYEVLSDLGLGLNYRKPGLKKLLNLIFQRRRSHQNRQRLAA